MSTETANVCNSTSATKHCGSCINAGIDSTFRSDPAHRGSLTPPELDSIHQTNSFKQAIKIQKQDNRELNAKKKELEKRQNSVQE